MEVKKILFLARKKLEQKKFPAATLEATRLLSFILNKSPEFLFTYPDFFISKNLKRRFDALLKKRLTGLPLAYITNAVEFYGLPFYVNRHTLIPRPETELLVEEALRIIKKNPRIKTVAEIGCGSGSLICAIAKHAPTLKYLTTDISKNALKVAQKNIKFHKLKIETFQGDLLKPIKNKKIDLLVANLPYLSTNLKLTTPETLGLKFEPKQALFAGASGTKIFERFFKQLTKYQIAPDVILMEIGHDERAVLVLLCDKLLGGVYRTKFIKDLQKKYRVLILRRVKNESGIREK